MKFNLSNEEFYCEFWRRYFEDILSAMEHEKVDNKTDVEIGHYNFATKIAYGFPNSYAKKKFIHKIFRNESYYPKSMLINKIWTKKNISKVTEFIGQERKVLKNNNGVGSKEIRLVNNVNDCLKQMNNHDFYVLQNEIQPYLYNNQKLDERVYYLVVKEGNTYSGFMMKEGHIKLAGFPFDKNNNSMGSFATNIKAPKPDKEQDYTIETKEFLKDNPQRELWIKNRLEIMKKISDKFLPVIVNNVKNYYKNKKEPEYIWHLYGIDILIDNDYNMYLCEFNGKPGVIYETVMPKKIVEINKKMCNKLVIHFLLPWLKDKKNVFNKGIIKLSSTTTENLVN